MTWTFVSSLFFSEKYRVVRGVVNSPLTFTTFWVNSSDDKLVIFFPDNRIWHFMQTVSNGDNLHEMSNPIFWKKKKKYFKILSAWNFTQSAKHLGLTSLWGLIRNQRSNWVFYCFLFQGRSTVSNMKCYNLLHMDALIKYLPHENVFPHNVEKRVVFCCHPPTPPTPHPYVTYFSSVFCVISSSIFFLYFSSTSSTFWSNCSSNANNLTFWNKSKVYFTRWWTKNMQKFKWRYLGNARIMKHRPLEATKRRLEEQMKPHSIKKNCNRGSSLVMISRQTAGWLKPNFT